MDTIQINLMYTIQTAIKMECTIKSSVMKELVGALIAKEKEYMDHQIKDLLSVVCVSLLIMTGGS